LDEGYNNVVSIGHLSETEIITELKPLVDRESILRCIKKHTTYTLKCLPGITSQNDMTYHTTACSLFLPPAKTPSTANLLPFLLSGTNDGRLYLWDWYLHSVLCVFSLQPKMKNRLFSSLMGEEKKNMDDPSSSSLVEICSLCGISSNQQMNMAQKIIIGMRNGTIMIGLITAELDGQKSEKKMPINDPFSIFNSYTFQNNINSSSYKTTTKYVFTILSKIDLHIPILRVSQKYNIGEYLVVFEDGSVEEVVEHIDNSTSLLKMQCDDIHTASKNVVAQPVSCYDVCGDVIATAPFTYLHPNKELLILLWQLPLRNNGNVYNIIRNERVIGTSLQLLKKLHVCNDLLKDKMKEYTFHTISAICLQKQPLNHSRLNSESKNMLFLTLRKYLPYSNCEKIPQSDKPSIQSNKLTREVVVVDPFMVGVGISNGNVILFDAKIEKKIWMAHPFESGISSLLFVHFDEVYYL
jgi:hypothetical protein